MCFGIAYLQQFFCGALPPHTRIAHSIIPPLKNHLYYVLYMYIYNGINISRPPEHTDVVETHVYNSNDVAHELVARRRAAPQDQPQH